jgi:hypothetical protein
LTVRKTDRPQEAADDRYVEPTWQEILFADKGGLICGGFAGGLATVGGVIGAFELHGITGTVLGALVGLAVSVMAVAGGILQAWWIEDLDECGTCHKWVRRRNETTITRPCCRAWRGAHLEDQERDCLRHHFTKQQDRLRRGLGMCSEAG